MSERGTQSFLAADALAALGTTVCRKAGLGARLINADCVTLATRERIQIDGAWLACWRRTDAWPPGLEGPITLPAVGHSSDPRPR